MLNFFFKILILGIFFSFYGKINAQAQVNLDSLASIWNDENAADTSRLSAIGILAEEGYLFSNPDTAFIILQQQYDFAASKDLKGYMSEALSKQAFSYLLRSKYFFALDLYQKSLKLTLEINDEPGISGSLNGIGIIYSLLNDYEKSLEYFSRAFEMNKKLGNQRINAAATINIAGCYFEFGEYNKALSLVSEGIAICEAINETRFLANGHDLRGKIYHALGETTKSKTNFQSALTIFTEIGDDAGYAECAGNFGSFYNDIGAPLKAIEFCEKSMELSNVLESLRENKSACECLYIAFKSLGNEEKALNYHEKMLVAIEGLQKEDASKSLQQMEFTKQMFSDSMRQEAEKLSIQLQHTEEVRKKNQTRNYLAGTGFILLLVSGGFFSRWNYVRKSKAIIEAERDRSDDLLLNILPVEIARELKENGKAEARDFNLVSILFTDFKDFTEASANMSAGELVNEINICFEFFDSIIQKYNVEKIKTIGDAYMAAGGLPVPTEDSVKNTVMAALEMQDFISKRKLENELAGKPGFEMRVGIHSGPVVAGIVGVKKFQYDVWGDTVNTASRMESHCLERKVNISGPTYTLIKDVFRCTYRGKIKVKGKGELDMYYVEGLL